ncbi:MAG: hypothetical protein M5R36_07655 [Deltaproteobacteria bacterium]|nr:hypothetical protein [Deltaproteobacteria bacterium]
MGRWSLQLGRPFGIPLRLHWTFLVLLGYVVLSGGREAAAANTLLFASVFASVVLHELGHSLAALRYKIGVRDITPLAPRRTGASRTLSEESQEAARHCHHGAGGEFCARRRLRRARASRAGRGNDPRLVSC